MDNEIRKFILDETITTSIETALIHSYALQKERCSTCTPSECNDRVFRFELAKLTLDYFISSYLKFCSKFSDNAMAVASIHSIPCLTTVSSRISVMKIIGTSMKPTIEDNDYMILKKLGKDKKELKKGDIVGFFSNEHLLGHPCMIYHRIKNIDGSLFVTKGDNNRLEDYPISSYQIEEKVISVIKPKDKYYEFIKKLFEAK